MELTRKVAIKSFRRWEESASVIEGFFYPASSFRTAKKKIISMMIHPRLPVGTWERIEPWEIRGRTWKFVEELLDLWHWSSIRIRKKKKEWKTVADKNNIVNIIRKCNRNLTVVFVASLLGIFHLSLLFFFFPLLRASSKVVSVFTSHGEGGSSSEEL